MFRESNFLGVDGSSRNVVVHSSLGLSGLNWKSDNFLWVVYSRGINESDVGFFLVVDRLNVVLGVDGVPWDGHVSYSGVALVGGRHNSWFEGSSYFRRVDDLDYFPVFLNGRLYISVGLNGVSWDVHRSLLSSVGFSDRKSDGVSGHGSSWESVVGRNCSLSNVKNGVLVVDSLSDWGREGFGEDLRFSGYSRNFDLWLSGYVSGDYSWFEFNDLGLSLLGFRF